MPPGVQSEWLWAPEWGEPSAWDKGLHHPLRGGAREQMVSQPFTTEPRAGRASKGPGAGRRGHRGSGGLSNFSSVSHTRLRGAQGG